MNTSEKPAQLSKSSTLATLPTPSEKEEQTPTHPPPRRLKRKLLDLPAELLQLLTSHLPFADAITLKLASRHHYHALDSSSDSKHAPKQTPRTLTRIKRDLSAAWTRLTTPTPARTLPCTTCNQVLPWHAFELDGLVFHDTDDWISAATRWQQVPVCLECRVAPGAGFKVSARYPRNPLRCVNWLDVCKACGAVEGRWAVCTHCRTCAPVCGCPYCGRREVWVNGRVYTGVGPGCN